MATYKTAATTINLRDGALYGELLRRSEAFSARVQEFTLGASGFTWPASMAKDTARFYARNLAKLDIDTAAEIRRVLVSDAEAAEDAFWGTDLGRALFLLHANPREGLTRAQAGAILRTEHRQRVHQLLKDGSLEPGPDGLVSAESVRSMFHVQ